VVLLVICLVLNYAMGATSYNDQAEMRNQWLAAQGRDPLYQKAKTTY